MPNLLASFLEFRKGKKAKSDVAEFSALLTAHIVRLYDDLASGAYRHGSYTHFTVSDPKRRDIHKASVRDRVVHHALYLGLYAYFDRLFIHDSYSCRIKKGTHRALERFEEFGRKESRNHTRSVWALRGDIRKCFASVDHAVLKEILQKHITCPRTFAVIETVIDSFNSGMHGKGIPLGNLTSQLFINIYMNEFDQYIKRTIKANYYLRYADDFVIVSADRSELQRLIPLLQDFLATRLHLELHPKKVSIDTIAHGLDVLGWVHFPHHRVLRTTTKRRMLANITLGTSATLASYRGMLVHGNGHNLCGVLESYYGKGRTADNRAEVFG